MNEEKPVNEVAKVRQEMTVSSAPLLNVIAEAARDPNTDVSKLRELVALQREILADEAKGEFIRAMFRLQAKLKPMVKRGMVTLGDKKGGYSFLRREDQDAILRPLMEEEGFAISFTSKQRDKDGGGAVVIAELMHQAGHSRTAEISLPLDTGPGRNNLQALGSTIAYSQRYLVEMLFSIVRTNDDDGKLGGTKFITPDQVAELEALIKDVGRDEGPFLDRMFGGAVRSFEEIEAGTAFLAVKNTLEGIKAQQAKKAT